MANTKTHLRLGTRGSLLARTQSGIVARALEEKHPGLRVELVEIRTTGDQVTDRPLADVGGKGLFTKELEIELLHGQIDFAVHSFKDVPVTMPLVDQADLIIAAVPLREDPRDVLVSAGAKDLKGLGERARVGTGSLRRAAQVLEQVPGAEILPIRGNIDTRIRKLRDGEFDATLLAMAGVRRANLYDASLMRALEMDVMLAAPGQGALALQCRREDSATRELLDVLNDVATASAVAAEREIVLALNGDCHSPIGANAKIEGSSIFLQAIVGRRDGKPPVIRGSAKGEVGRVKSVIDDVIAQLARQGVHELLGTRG